MNISVSTLFADGVNTVGAEHGAPGPALLDGVGDAHPVRHADCRLDGHLGIPIGFV